MYKRIALGKSYFGRTRCNYTLEMLLQLLLNCVAGRGEMEAHDGWKPSFVLAMLIAASINTASSGII